MTVAEKMELAAVVHAAVVVAVGLVRIRQGGASTFDDTCLLEVAQGVARVHAIRLTFVVERVLSCSIFERLLCVQSKLAASRGFLVSHLFLACVRDSSCC